MICMIFQWGFSVMEPVSVCLKSRWGIFAAKENRENIRKENVLHSFVSEKNERREPLFHKQWTLWSGPVQKKRSKLLQANLLYARQRAEG